MTEKEFQQIPDGTIFATGTIPNSPEGIFMTRNGGELRWIAKKGYGNDWTIYCHWSSSSVEYIEEQGDKVFNNTNILKCLPEAEPILHLYRS